MDNIFYDNTVYVGCPLGVGGLLGGWLVLSHVSILPHLWSEGSETNRQTGIFPYFPFGMKEQF